MMRVISCRAAALLAIAVGTLAQQSATETGIQAFEQGRYSSAIEVLKHASDSRGRLFFAMSLAGAGDCRQALPLLSQPGGNDPKLELMRGLTAAKCDISLDDSQGALQTLGALEAQYPDNADVLYLLARLHIKGFNDASLAMFRKAPASYRVHQLSAEIFEIDARYDEAAAEYRRAIELNPRAPDLHFRLGRAILLHSHDPQALDQAAEQFRAELKVSPEDSASEYQLAQIAGVRGDTAAARTALTRAITLSPTFVAALVALAKIDLKESKTSDAIQLLTRATAAQPDNESAHYALMTAYRNAGDLARAKQEKAILDRLARPPEGEFSEFLKRLGEKPAPR